MEPNCGAGCTSVGGSCFQTRLPSIQACSPWQPSACGWVAVSSPRRELQHHEQRHGAPREPRARATVWASFRFNQRRIYRGKSGRTLIHISSSTSRCAPDRTGPQIFPLRPVTSVLCMKSAITKGEEAMAVRGQKMLNDPFLLKRKSVTSVGGGGAKLFSSMLLTAFCSHPLRLSTHFKFRVSSQGLWLSCPTHRYRQMDVSLPTPNPDSHTLHNPGVGRHGFHYINQYSHFL